MTTDPRFYIHDLDINDNLPDLQREVDDLRAAKGRMVGIVDEKDGGIIAYAMSACADDLVATLNAAEVQP